MKYTELLILLPCHSLEDFPMYHEGEEAAGLLANWTALWHPAFIASAAQMPQWYRADDPPEQLEGRLMLVPSVSSDQLPTGFSQRAKASGACLIRRKSSRPEILAQALADLDGGAGPVDDDLAADFLALGYGYLQVELLTRQMRYSSNLDEIHFDTLVVDAARAAMAGEAAAARDKLAACFDLLSEERDLYYAVDAYLVDIVMVEPTTLGEGLARELAEESAVNFLLGGETLEAMLAEAPEQAARLRARWETGTAGVLGGEAEEVRLPLLSHETIRRHLVRGQELFQRCLGRAPTVFGRRRYGLTPILPGLLATLGYQGALHAAMEEGGVPEGSQTKTRWQGVDGQSLDALTRVPLDAAKPETFLGLALKLGESMDSDHVATLCLAHWPGHAACWLEDLRRVSKFGSMLGKWVTVDQYFRETDTIPHGDDFAADKYRSPYLKQAVIRRSDAPLSAPADYWRGQALHSALNGCSTLCELLTGKRAPTGDGAPTGDDADTGDGADPDGADERPLTEAQWEQWNSQLGQAGERLVAALTGTQQPPAAAAPQGYLVLNPCSFVRRLNVELPGLERAPAVGRPVYATSEAAPHETVVDVPPMGYVWLEPQASANKPAKVPPLAEHNLLRNDFFEVLVNPKTGGIQAIHSYDSRSNRLSQQLAMRLPDGGGRRGQYSTMVADSLEVTACTAVHGAITTRGRLLDPGGELLAQYQQRLELWRGSRVVQMDIELDPVKQPKSDAWESYYAARFAWPNEAAEVRRNVHQLAVPSEARRLEAPLFVELADGKERTTLLTCGMPYHRRRSYNTLDSLLVVRGEPRRKFRLGIGVDLTHPVQAAWGWLLPPLIYPLSGPPPAQTSGWLFHVDAKNVLVTSWEAIYEGQQVVGVRARLLETEGRTARCRLSGFRPFTGGQRLDAAGRVCGDATLEDGSLRCELSRHEWAILEARW